VKPYYANSNDSPFTCLPFSRVSEFVEAKKIATDTEWIRSQPGNFFYSGQDSLAKNVSTRDQIRWSMRSVTLLGIRSQDAIKATSERLQKTATMVFTVHGDIC